MLGFVIRCILSAFSLFLLIYSFVTGHWGWGIVMIFVTALVVLTFFRNQYMILALNQMRVGNHEKAHDYLKKISRPDLLPKKQHAYVLYLKAMLGTQELGFAKSEQMLRSAIQMGLRTKQDNAVARLHLSGICAQTGRKSEALTLLGEAKKMDENGILKEQITMMKSQLTSAIPSKNQMRMAQMTKGRQKMPRAKK
jgi:tetratricopeptide (TPR) repeat protein